MFFRKMCKACGDSPRLKSSYWKFCESCHEQKQAIIEEKIQEMYEYEEEL